MKTMGEAFERNIRLAVVGPQDSVELIIRVGSEGYPALTLVPMIYEDASEAAELVLRPSADVDAWLFSGIAPYSYARSSGVTDKTFLYVPHTGPSLYRVLLQAVYRDKRDISAISFDSFRLQEISETLQDSGIPLPVIEMYPGRELSAKDITEWHYDLWQRGKVKFSITCFLATFKSLSKRRVPCYRIWPTRDAIRTSFDMAIRMVEGQRYKGSQIAVQHIAIDNFEEIQGRNSSAYTAKRHDLALYRLLLDYGEAINGTIVRGEGRYTVYSTRGSIEDFTAGLQSMPVIDALKRELTITVSGGIGFGSTAYEADRNAHVALQLSAKAGAGNWTVVTDDGKVVGPLGSPTGLRYSLRSTDALCRKWCRHLQVSATTVQRLWSVLDKLRGKPITAEELSRYLAINERSGRRLLKSCVKARIARIVGEEAPTRGRPSKLYRIEGTPVSSLRVRSSKT